MEHYRLDCEQVLDRIKAQNVFSKDEPMFIQMGIHHDQGGQQERIHVGHALAATPTYTSSQ